MRKTLVAAITATVVLAVAQGASAASHTAYFKVRLVASQHVTWSKHLTFDSCGGGKVQLDGSGTSAIHVRTPSAQPAVARRVGGGRVTLAFRNGASLLPVVGTISRNGVSSASGGGSATDPKCTTRPEAPITPDCGTKPYPGGTTIGVGYYTPEDWPYNSGPTPLVPSLVLTGPGAPGWHGMVYQWCPGANGDEVFRGPIYDPEAPSTGPGGLPPAKLFGTLRSFTVTGRTHDTVDTAKRIGLNGTFPITTETSWKLKFTRVAHRPAGL